MSEHSIEELDRQYKAAQSRAHQAQSDVREAKKRLLLAKLEATGLEGHVVSFVRTTWRRSEPEVIRFIVRRLSGWRDDEVEGPIIKKDGTPGERDARAAIKNVEDHGLYQASAQP